MAKISILMPACNVEKYIRECMDSIIGQTLKDIEIIVVDDGSSDDTGKILDEYAAADQRVKVIHKVNTGYGHSMNVALDNATGEYIGIIETDDFADPEMFERLYETARANDADVVKSNFYNYYSTRPEKCGVKLNLDQVGVYDKVISPEKEQTLFLVMPSIWSGIYKRSMIEDKGIRFTETPGASYQDTAFIFKIWAVAERVVLLKEAYLHYRRDNDSSSVNNPGKVFCVCDEVAEIDAYLDRYPGKKALLEDITNTRVARIYRWNLRRLGLEYKFAFLMAVSEWFRVRKESGKLREDMFEKDVWEDICGIAGDPLCYFREVCRKQLKGKASVKEVLEENKQLKKKLKDIKASNSYKIGRTVTAAPRALKKLLPAR